MNFKSKKMNFKSLLSIFIIFFSSFNFCYNSANAQCVGNNLYPNTPISVSSSCLDTFSINGCNYMGDYSRITSVDSGFTYRINNLTNSSWVSIFQGGTGSNGILIGEGTTPINFTTSDDNDIWIHWFSDSLCTTVSGCNQTEISIVSADFVVGCTDSIALNFDSLATCNSGCLYSSGCTDVTAINFDSTAYINDGSCIYTCQSSSQYESFELGNLASSLWYNDINNSPNGWVFGNSTPTFGTGPSSAFNGNSFLYVEGNGASASDEFFLVSKCIDLSTINSPMLIFAYHMHGTGVGTLDLEISTDTGTTWTNIWSSSGDKGNIWIEDTILLTQYLGPAKLRFKYYSATNQLSDCAIDFIRIEQSPVYGCTDLFATNYDSLATLDDGSCYYTGCLDRFATNYCSSCSVGDSSYCTYPRCNNLPISETFEDTSLSANNWITYAGNQSSVNLSLVNPISGNVSLAMSSNNSYANIPNNDLDAFSDSLNNENVSFASICMDLSSSNVTKLTAKVKFPNANASSSPQWLRVLVDGNVIFDVDSFRSITNRDSSFIVGPVRTNASDLDSIIWDLSAFAGNSNVNITFQALCANGLSVEIDNIKIYEELPCSYFTTSVSSTDALCYGSSDGTASAAFTNLLGSSLSSYLWSNGDTNSTAFGLSAGNYNCIISDLTNNCSDTLSVTILEPTDISISSIIVDATDSISNNGAINLTVSGGTPCVTEIQLGTSNNTTVGNTGGGALFYTYFHDNISEITFLSSELSSLGVQIGQQLNSLAWQISYASGQAMNNLNIEIQESGQTFSVFSGTYTAVLGWNTFNFSTPFTWNGGDIKIITCFDNSSYTSANNFFYTQTSFNSCISNYSDNAAGCNLVPQYNTSERPNTRFGLTQNRAYNYLWSNGDSTLNVNNLAVGNYFVNITDCNNCNYSQTFTVNANIVYGCLDSLAWNYNPQANTDDSSCISFSFACLDSSAYNYVPFDSISSNTNDSNLCIAKTYGCTDSSSINYDLNANTDDGSCLPYIYGCMDSLALNYDSTANSSLNSNCIYPPCAEEAPYVQSFSNSSLPVGICVPNQWSTSQISGDGWKFSGTPGYAAASNGRTSGQYAWVDFSGTDDGVILQVEDIDIAALTNPALLFDFFSYNSSTFTNNNILNVEFWNGYSWVIGMNLMLFS